MSNNHSIKILRGTRITVNKDNFADKEDKLYAGQPIYLTDLNYLAIGTADNSDTSKVNKLPINVREVQGYWDDNDGIVSGEGEEAVDERNGVWHLGPDTTNTRVEFKVTGKPLSIVTDNSSIIENAIANSLIITHGDDSNTSNKYWKIYDSTDTTPELNILGNGQRVHVKSQNVTDDIAIYLETGSTNSIDLSGGSVVLHVKSTSGGQTTERTLSFINSTVGDGVDFGASQDNFYGASKKLIDAPALTASGNTITVTAGGQTSSAFTVPFATKASQLKVGTNTYYTFTKANAVPLTPASGTIYLIY